MIERSIQAYRTRHWWAWFDESLISTIVGFLAAGLISVLIEVLVITNPAATSHRGV